ncbi:ABC transporter permease [candidate division KSB1 bacterium]
MKSNKKKPSFFAELIIRHLGNRKDKHAILGDLEEEFNDRIREGGLIRAKLWYWRLILISIPSFINENFYRSMLMLKNYLKIAFRNLLRHKGYSFINIIGFSIGMACSILIVLFIFDELSFDKHHKKFDHIYRVGSAYGPEKSKGAFTAPPMAGAFIEDFPEIENVVRLSLWPRNYLISYNKTGFIEKRIIYADSSIFNVFTIPLLKGDPNTALKDPHTIVITESIASKYFGEDNPLGKLLKINSEETPYTVTGLIGDCPVNSHFQYDLIISLTTSSNSRSDGWMGHTYFTYIVLREGYPPSQLEEKFPGFIKRHYGPRFFSETGQDYGEFIRDENNYYGYWLQPLSDIHLNKETGYLSKTTDEYLVYVFSVIAVFILLIACINFMNLSTARYTGRSKEVGVRKVLGSSREQLIRQYISESVLLSIVSLIIAVLILEAVLPSFNRFTDKKIALTYFSNIYMLPGFVLFAITVGALSGSYPAFFLSSFQPAYSLKNTRDGRRGTNILLRKALVVFQFTVSVIILTGTIIVYEQLKYIRNEELGFKKDNIIVIHRGSVLGENYEAFRNELISHPEILCTSSTWSLPGRHFDSNGHHLEGEPSSMEHVLYTMYSDHEFADLLDLQMAEGRFFSEEFASDADAVIINETAVKELRLSEPVGKRFDKEFGDHKKGDFVTVIGVIKDIKFFSLHEKIRPMIIRNIANIRPNFISVRVNDGYIQSALTLIEEKWGEFSGSQPLEFSFLDEDLFNLYKDEQKTGKVFTLFSSLAVLIACLGLFGLVTLAAEQRTKEIGIRKALGARISGIILLLSGETALLVIIASLIASPIAYLGMKNWLQNFAYRIGLSPLLFIFTTILILVIALLTVSFQAYKAARANPVNSLKYE